MSRTLLVRPPTVRGCLRAIQRPLVPRVSEFFGIAIYIYYQDDRVHHTPHFHAEYAGE